MANTANCVYKLLFRENRLTTCKLMQYVAAECICKLQRYHNILQVR